MSSAPAPIPLSPPPPPEAPEVPEVPRAKDTVVEFEEIQSYLDKQYNSDNSNKSVICDIIAMYLKGQKILYTEAKTLCEQRMNYLMLPAIFITSLCSILGLVLKDISYGPTIVSSFNGFNAFLLAVISYLKLDAKAEAHRTSAYKFDALQSRLEFSSGKSMFMEVTYEDMRKIITDTEANVKEIKETNKFILPEDIRTHYPKLCNMNVFAEIKKIQNTEMLVSNRLKDVVNELRLLSVRVDVDRRRVEELLTLEKALTSDIIALKDDYLMIDDVFEKEMTAERERNARICQPFGWLKT